MPRNPTLRPTRSTFVLLLMVCIAVARVASTHRVFSATADEPVHVASGYDWITRGVYIFDPEHPPLARGLFGLGLRMGGVVSPVPEDWQTIQPTWKATNRGMELLWQGGDYVHNLANARRGNLVFLIVAMLAVWAWARRAFGDVVALIAVALFSSLPPILAHAGLATTDMAVAATLPLALLALERWLEQPTLSRAIVLGVAVGIGVASKLSFALFFVVAGTIVVLTFRRRPHVRLALLAVAIAMFVVWSIYGFEWRTFVTGLVWARAHEARGHFGFLLGKTGTEGWWYYFPVALAVKSPLPFLLLFVHGAIRSAKKTLHYALIPLALLIAVMPVSLNIGVRHVLAVYPAMAIVAAFGAVALWSKNKTIVVALLAWHAVGTSLAHPDYLAWFNETSPRPERILGDSNLDWGQDMLRLSAVAREEKIPQLSILLFGPAGFDRVPLPPHTQLAPRIPVQGWIAVSETALQSANPGDYDWLTRYRPKRRVGKSIRLYHIR